MNRQTKKKDTQTCREGVRKIDRHMDGQTKNEMKTTEKEERESRDEDKICDKLQKEEKMFLRQYLYPLSRIFIPAFLKTLFLVHGVSWCSSCSWCSLMRTIKREDDCVCGVLLREREVFWQFFFQLLFAFVLL